MDLKALKLELLKHILQSESQELLNKLLNTIKKEEKDFYADLTVEQKQDIELARNQIKSGQVEDWEAVYLRLSSKTHEG